MFETLVELNIDLHFADSISIDRNGLITSTLPA